MVTHHRRSLALALDALAVLAAYALAFLIGNGFRLLPADSRLLGLTAPCAALAYLATSLYFCVNHGLRYHASFGDVVDIVKAALSAAVLQSLVIRGVAGTELPPAVVVSWPIYSILFVAGLHAIVRGAAHHLRVRLRGHGDKRSAVIVGIGDQAELVYQNMRSDEEVDYRVVAFVDDDSKFGVRLHGARVLSVAALAKFLQRTRVDEIVVAVDRDRRGGALDSVANALRSLSERPAILVAPTLVEALKSPVRGQPRKVRPADLLNRRVISLDAERITRSIREKVVMIAGAGGTIGGELSRQVASYGPRRVILLDNNATSLFYGEAGLRGELADVDVVPLLGDVRDLTLLGRIFRDERPQIVFHAAAHKHVHQLETNVWEGVSNNLVGTYHLACASDRAGVEAFILISTDKAVLPKSVMGATKRAAEIVVSHFARTSRTRFASVRFGNVLGSSGSVMKIFEGQIERRQPITITHPDATRYFMTVEEAVGLVLQAAALAKGGEIFVLKMGEQVRILDMARRLIRLSGLEPDRDVPIRVIGLRPGEKIAEQLVEDPSLQQQSEHPEIIILRSNDKEIEALAEGIQGIELLNSASEIATMMRVLARIVPTFAVDPGREGIRVRSLEAPHDGPSAN